MFSLISTIITDTHSAKSYLITSFCWDTTVKWIESSIEDFPLNSEAYGNYGVYAKNTLGNILTGTNEQYRIKNIYDLAGNVLEFTTEESYSYSFDINGDYKIVNKSSCVLRGEGHELLDTKKIKNCVSRFTMYPYAAGMSWGFRVILYLK